MIKLRCDVCGKKINYCNRTDDNLKLCDNCNSEELELCTFCGHTTISYNVVNGLKCGSCDNNKNPCNN